MNLWIYYKFIHHPEETYIPACYAYMMVDGTSFVTCSFWLFLFDRCMYDWNPHDGEPITSLFFLDDHKHLVQEWVHICCFLGLFFCLVVDSFLLFVFGHLFSPEWVHISKVKLNEKKRQKNEKTKLRRSLTLSWFAMKNMILNH